MREINVDGRRMLSLSAAELREGDTVGGRALEVAHVGAQTYLRIPAEDGRTLCELMLPDAAATRITVDARAAFNPARLADQLAATQAARAGAG